ncbi:MAG: signal peptidase I [Bacteroidales bacterium]|nr:signal peptidase I [Bacteroidales bacterium]
MLIIILGILLAIGLRVFVFAVFTIPTPSMQPSIEHGDRIVVNKLIPGPRLISNLFSLRDGATPIYTRLPGWRGIKRNDVLIFNYPYSDWQYLDLDRNIFYAKRCVAIPKDTFYIENGIYKVKGVADTLGHYPSQKQFYNIPSEQLDPNIYNCFPFDERYGWNIKSFGPLYVPAKGDTLAVHVNTLVLYKNLIIYETKKNISIDNDKVLLGDSVINYYVFGKNYYFMAGDLVYDSQDSRYWGLLPEDHIIGKVSFIYKSVDPYTGKNRWSRFFKTVK